MSSCDATNIFEFISCQKKIRWNLRSMQSIQRYADKKQLFDSKQANSNGWKGNVARKLELNFFLSLHVIFANQLNDFHKLEKIARFERAHVISCGFVSFRALNAKNAVISKRVCVKDVSKQFNQHQHFTCSRGKLMYLSHLMLE